MPEACCPHDRRIGTADRERAAFRVPIEIAQRFRMGARRGLGTSQNRVPPISFRAQADGGDHGADARDPPAQHGRE